MALWSTSSLEAPNEDSDRDGGGGPMAEDVRKLEPIIKFSNLSDDANVNAHCERVRSLVYNKDRYVSLHGHVMYIPHLINC